MGQWVTDEGALTDETDVYDLDGSRLAALVMCPFCSQEVELWQQRDAGEPGGFDEIAQGECCGRTFLEWWEGTFILEPEPARPIQVVSDPTRIF